MKTQETVSGIQQSTVVVLGLALSFLPSSFLTNAFKPTNTFDI